MTPNVRISAGRGCYDVFQVEGVRPEEWGRVGGAASVWKGESDLKSDEAVEASGAE